MAINPLQLPGPIKQPELDWSGLNSIGDSLQRIRQERAEVAALDQSIGSATARPVPGQMRGEMPNPSGAPNELDSLVEQTAQRHGLDPRHLRRYVQLESGGRVDAVSPSGRHFGLLQLDKDEFARRGGKDPTNPAENLEIGARWLRENKEALTRRLGREPNATELYLAHQQGLGGVSSHMAAPDKPAWQNMLSTKEGRDRAARDPAAAEAWAKSAIWGNVPQQLQARFGSVDNITSGDFLRVWQMRVEAADQPAPAPTGQPAPAPGARQLTEAQAARLRAMAQSGPRGRAAVQELMLKFGMPRDPIKLGEGDTLLDGETYQPLARGPAKPQSVRPGGALVDGNGRVIYQAPNADRGETEEQKLNAQMRVRETTATRLGLVGDARQRYIATGKIESDRPEPGENEEQKLEAQIRVRTRMAERLGMRPDEPETRRYITTGQMAGNERFSAPALKILQESEDENLKLETTLSSLARVKELSDAGIISGFGTRARTWVGTQIPAMLDKSPDPRAQRTEEWLSYMRPEAIKDMAATLKGATTDREMSTYMNMLADPSTTKETRDAIWVKINGWVSKQRAINERRMDQLRSGEYTRTGGGDSGNRQPGPAPTGAKPIPPEAVADLKTRLSAAGSDAAARNLVQRQFDEIFGKGAFVRATR